MKTKFDEHTPRPWRVEGNAKPNREIRQPLACFPHLEGTGRLLFTSVFSSKEDCELAAAAPDLLDRLKSAYEVLASCHTALEMLSPKDKSFMEEIESELRAIESLLGLEAGK